MCKFSNTLLLAITLLLFSVELECKGFDGGNRDTGSSRTRLGKREWGCVFNSRPRATVTIPRSIHRSQMNTPLTPQSYPSYHGFTPNYYPSRNHFGYPGQGLFGGSDDTKYKGMGLFGNPNSYAYPGSGSWDYPSYGTGGFKSNKNNDKLQGYAIGAYGSYKTGKLVNRILNPWNYYEYGHGHDERGMRGYYGRAENGSNHYDSKDRESTTTTPPEPENNWINCMAVDTVRNSIIIIPNCRCTTKTTIDPSNNRPNSIVTCTTFGGEPTALKSSSAESTEGVDNFNTSSPNPELQEKGVHPESTKLADLDATFGNNFDVNNEARGSGPEPKNLTAVDDII